MGKQRRPALPKEGPPHKGRPPLLTPELSQAIINNRELLGMPEGLSGEAEGVDFTTVSFWKSRGRRAFQAWDKLPPAKREAELPYLNFFKALRDARPKFIKTNLTVIQNAAVGGDWRAAARRLEFEAPEMFAKAAKLVGDPKNPVKFSLAEDLADRLKAARARLKKKP
jgi:hypothetical protein